MEDTTLAPEDVSRGSEKVQRFIRDGLHDEAFAVAFRLGDTLLNVNAEQALEFFEQARECAEDFEECEDIKPLSAISYRYLAICMATEGNSRGAEDYARLCLSAYTDMKDGLNIARAFVQMGQVYLEKSSHDCFASEQRKWDAKAVRYCETALDKLRDVRVGQRTYWSDGKTTKVTEEEIVEERVKAHTNIAGAYYDWSAVAQCSQLKLHYLELACSHYHAGADGDVHQSSSCLRGLGSCYERQGDLKSCEEMYRKNAEFLQQHEEKDFGWAKDYGSVLCLRARNFLRQEEWAEATVCLKRAHRTVVGYKKTDQEVLPLHDEIHQELQDAMRRYRTLKEAMNLVDADVAAEEDGLDNPELNSGILVQRLLDAAHEAAETQQWSTALSIYTYLEPLVTKNKNQSDTDMHHWLTVRTELCRSSLYKTIHTPGEKDHEGLHRAANRCAKIYRDCRRLSDEFLHDTITAVLMAADAHEAYVRELPTEAATHKGDISTITDADVQQLVKRRDKHLAEASKLYQHAIELANTDAASLVDRVLTLNDYVLYLDMTGDQEQRDRLERRHKQAQRLYLEAEEKKQAEAAAMEPEVVERVSSSEDDDDADDEEEEALSRRRHKLDRLNAKRKNPFDDSETDASDFVEVVEQPTSTRRPSIRYDNSDLEREFGVREEDSWSSGTEEADSEDPHTRTEEEYRQALEYEQPAEDEIEARWALGQFLYAKADYEACMEEFELCWQLAEQLHLPFRVVDAKVQLANSMQLAGELDGAFVMFQDLLMFVHEMREKNVLQGSLWLIETEKVTRNIGVTYMARAEQAGCDSVQGSAFLKEAKQCFRKCLRMLRQVLREDAMNMVSFCFEKSSVLLNMGNAASYQGNFQEAKRLLKRSQSTSDQHKDNIYMAVKAQVNLCELLVNHGDYKAAVAVGEDSLRLAAFDPGNSAMWSNMILVYKHLGVAYYELTRYSKARKCFERGFRLSYKHFNPQQGEWQQLEQHIRRCETHLHLTSTVEYHKRRLDRGSERRRKQPKAVCRSPADDPITHAPRKTARLSSRHSPSSAPSSTRDTSTWSSGTRRPQPRQPRRVDLSARVCAFYVPAVGPAVRAYNRGNAVPPPPVVPKGRKKRRSTTSRTARKPPPLVKLRADRAMRQRWNDVVVWTEQSVRRITDRHLAHLCGDLCWMPCAFQNKHEKAKRTWVLFRDGRPVMKGGVYTFRYACHRSATNYSTKLANFNMEYIDVE